MNEKWADHDNMSSDDLTNNSDRESLLSNNSIIEVFSDEEEQNFDFSAGNIVKNIKYFLMITFIILLITFLIIL